MKAEYWRRGLILQRLVKARIKVIAVIMQQTNQNSKCKGGKIVFSAKRGKNQPSEPIKIESKQATAPSARERKIVRTT